MGQRMSERILWIDPTRTTFVESFDGGKTVSVARRRTPDHVWGPPIWCQLDTSWRSSSGAWLVSVPGDTANLRGFLREAMAKEPVTLLGLQELDDAEINALMDAIYHEGVRRGWAADWHE